MLKEGYDVCTADHPAFAVELNVGRPIAYRLTRTLSVAYERNQIYLYFILKLLRISETGTCKFLYLNYQELNFTIYTLL